MEVRSFSKAVFSSSDCPFGVIRKTLIVSALGVLSLHTQYCSRYSAVKVFPAYLNMIKSYSMGSLTAVALHSCESKDLSHIDSSLPRQRCNMAIFSNSLIPLSPKSRPSSRLVSGLSYSCVLAKDSDAVHVPKRKLKLKLGCRLDMENSGSKDDSGVIRRAMSETDLQILQRQNSYGRNLNISGRLPSTFRNQRNLNENCNDASFDSRKGYYQPPNFSSAGSFSSRVEEREQADPSCAYQQVDKYSAFLENRRKSRLDSGSTTESMNASSWSAPDSGFNSDVVELAADVRSSDDSRAQSKGADVSSSGSNSPGFLDTSYSGESLFCNSKGCKPVGSDDRRYSVDTDLAYIQGSSRSGSSYHSSGESSSWLGTGVDVLEVERHYQETIEKDPGNPLLLHNYARFLHEVEGNLPKAEEFYERAILMNPGDGEVLSQYAKLIWQLYRDQERAAGYFDRAIKASPDNCFVLAAYASFLWSIDSVVDLPEEENLKSSRNGEGRTPEVV